MGHTRRRAAAALVALAMLATSAHSEDTVILNDGHIYTGKIISENSVLIEMETKVANIPTTLKIQRSRISSIVRDHENWKESETPEEPGEKEADNRPTVMEIPLVGVFGEEILPIGFKASLEYAARNDIQHIVLRINSPGGYLWAALQIVEDMKTYRGQMQFHALVEDAISASIWPTFMCETIHMAPSSSLGGAVIFRTDENGHEEVDAKFNSIRATELVAAAEPLGHNAHVIRAMILMPNELYAKTEGETITLSGGSTGQTGRTITRGGEGEQIDGPDTVLTLTSGDAARLGVARTLSTKSLDDLVADMAWGECNVVTGGNGLMKRWNDQCEQRKNLAEASAKKILRIAERVDEEQTIQGKIDALTAFQREHPRFANLLREYRECFPDVEMDIEPEEVRELSLKVRELIAELRRIQREGP